MEEREGQAIQLPRVQDVLKRRCTVCGELLAEQFLNGGWDETDVTTFLIVLATPGILGVDICNDCYQRQPKKGHLKKRWANWWEHASKPISFRPPVVGMSSDEFGREYSVENIKGSAQLICDSQPDPPVPEIPGSGGGSEMGIPAEAYMGNKKQQTFHFRHGKSAQKTYCDVKGSNIDLVVIDDDNVKIGCSHLSQGGFMEGHVGTCRYRSNLFVTRKCIFWGV